MRVTRKAMREAAKALIAARDRMNDGGRHWIKGAEKRMVDPNTHKPGNMGYYMVGNAPRHFEPAFCSVGALQEEGADGLAFVALAEIARPRMMAAARKRAEEWADSEIRKGSRLERERDGMVLECLVGEARSCIINFNDAKTRSWGDVRRAFTEAAERLTAMARSKS